MTGTSLSAQVRERPVPFDSAGRINVITAPLAARLGLSAPLWPVTGDYVDARLYAVDDVSSSFVLVVRRQREVLDRYAMDASARGQLAAIVTRGSVLAAGTTTPDAAPTFISEPVRGSFVLNQTLLGGIVFGPAAAYLVGDNGGGAAAFATYLAVTGGTFFTAASLTQSTTVSRAQNHLSWHSARRGAIAANLALYALAGGGRDDKVVALSLLAGGIIGDVVGFQVGKPMTDAEAHGTSHGSTVTAALMGGLAGTAGLYDDFDGLSDTRSRTAAALVVGAGAIGYPLGLRYVRSVPYRVTAGDVGTLVPAELLALTALGTMIPENAWSDNPKVVSGLLTAGFLGGAILGDRFLVRPFDHTEAEARLLMYGTAAGALVGVAIPVLADARTSNVYWGGITVGGLIGAALTTNFMKPASANLGVGSLPKGANGIARSRVDVRFIPEGAVLASMKQRGAHPLLAITF